MKNIISESIARKLCIFILLTMVCFITSCSSKNNDTIDNKDSQNLSLNDKKIESTSTVSPTKNNESSSTNKSNLGETNNNEKTDRSLEGTWPDNELAASIPKPREGLVRTVQSEEEKCAIYITMTFSQCQTYLKDIIEEGYLYDVDSYNEFIDNKCGNIQFGKEDGKAFKLNYTSGLLKIMIFGY